MATSEAVGSCADAPPAAPDDGAAPETVGGARDEAAPPGAGRADATPLGASTPTDAAAPGVADGNVEVVPVPADAMPFEDGEPSAVGIRDARASSIDCCVAV